MLIFIRIFLVLYGVIAIGTGLHAITGAYQPEVAPMADNSHRFVAAIWASMSFAFFYTAWKPASVDLFRFAMFALMVGGVVRTIALVNYPIDALILAGILLELVPPPIMLWMHTKLANLNGW